MQEIDLDLKIDEKSGNALNKCAKLDHIHILHRCAFEHVNTEQIQHSVIVIMSEQNRHIKPGYNDWQSSESRNTIKPRPVAAAEDILRRPLFL